MSMCMPVVPRRFDIDYPAELQKICAGEREGGSDDDFAQSTNLLSPPGHAVGADNESPSLPPSLNIEL